MGYGVESQVICVAGGLHIGRRQSVFRCFPGGAIGGESAVGIRRVVPVLCHMADDARQRHQEEQEGEQAEEKAQQVKEGIKHGGWGGVSGLLSA